MRSLAVREYGSVTVGIDILWHVRLSDDVGKVLVGMGRQGKHLWLVLEEGPGGKGKSKKGKAQPTQPTQQQHVLFHMGMTGSLVVKGKDVPQVRDQDRIATDRSINPTQQPPSRCSFSSQLLSSVQGLLHLRRLVAAQVHQGRICLRGRRAPGLLRPPPLGAHHGACTCLL